eukprot:TRINITY_DN67184_c9_g1_i1.p1 TRINITY_DN67184_c9_g1~~TRINITY_DN67184_c9_g1_i1.p1  ORF type:complete len:182 (+),score=98.47 TRINITY_DN67184_c9_g1_i1:78-623(+)
MSALSGAKPDNVEQEDWDKLQKELSKFSGSSKMTLEQLQNASPDSLGNNQEMESQWAEKAFKHAETYQNLLPVFADKTKLKLTKIDNVIYKHFRETFPKLDIAELDEDFIKSKEQKALWRLFCNVYKDGVVPDYNMGSLLRVRAKEPFGQHNCMIVPRIQFFAIEIARNREGLNDCFTKKN